MVQELETLLRINTVLQIVPFFVMAGVTRLMMRQRQSHEDLKKAQEDIAVLKAQREEDCSKIDRLQDLHNRRERMD